MNRIDQLTAVLAFTNHLSDETKRRATFAASDDTITDEQAIASARQQAEFVRARALKGTHTRSSIGMTEEEKQIAQETRAWVARKDKRMRGA